MHDKIKLLLTKIALEEQLSFNEVEEIYKLSYRGIKDAIQSGDRKNYIFSDVRMIGLGNFRVTNRAINFWRSKNEYNKIKQENNNSLQDGRSDAGSGGGDTATFAEGGTLFSQDT